jgi:hypothetical protein
MKAKIALLFLKACGLLLMVMGVYFRNVEFYPSIFNYFVPEYRHAEAGLAKLTST